MVLPTGKVKWGVPRSGGQGESASNGWNCLCRSFPPREILGTTHKPTIKMPTWIRLQDQNPAGKSCEQISYFKGALPGRRMCWLKGKWPVSTESRNTDSEKQEFFCFYPLPPKKKDYIWRQISILLQSEICLEKGQFVKLFLYLLYFSHKVFSNLCSESVFWANLSLATLIPGPGAGRWRSVGGRRQFLISRRETFSHWKNISFSVNEYIGLLVLQ